MNSDFIRTQYESNSVVTIETKYDTIKKLESSISATELVKRHDVEKATIADTKKQKYTTLRIMCDT